MLKAEFRGKAGQKQSKCMPVASDGRVDHSLSQGRRPEQSFLIHNKERAQLTRAQPPRHGRLSFYYRNNHEWRGGSGIADG